MLFNSLAYGIFLPVVFIIYWLIPDRYRWILLLVSSYYFYMSWNPKYVLLILTTTLVSYCAARLVETYESKRTKKLVLTGALVICLGLLFVFKYFNFFSESAVYLLSKLAIPVHPVTLKLLLPVGISFYTFQTLSYVIDVYRGDIKAVKNIGVYAAFISFFPQLVAGPIERARDLLPQITSKKEFDYDSATYGLKLMAIGFFKKLVIADNVSRYVDYAYNSLNSCTGLDLFSAVFFFTFQIYCDFSGYSDIAIGTAKLLGINLTQNFKSPYFSTSIKEFWSRWHISLSTWFRDYVYIPLGGNRCSTIKRDRNLIITFLLSGLWHGANWTYVIWGGIHGLAQIIENHLPKRSEKKAYKFLAWISVFVFCNIAWVFFRAPSLPDALYVIKTLITDLRYPSRFRQSTLGIGDPESLYCLFFIFVLAVYDLASKKTDVIKWISSKKPVIRWAVYLLLIWIILAFMPPTGTSEFVYFQF